MKRDIPKALKIANGLIVAHYKNADGIENLVKNYIDEPRELGLEIASVHREVAKCIELIVKAIQPQAVLPKEKKLVKIT